MTWSTPIIALEEHWVSPAVRTFYKSQGQPDPNDEDGMTGMFTPALAEIGPERLAAMEKSNVTVQVISHVSNSIALDVSSCIAANDQLFARTDCDRLRFKAFATLPMAHPLDAANELQRCVKNLGFLGALIDSNCNGRFYDDSFFWPVFAAAQELNVPIYLHPAPNAQTKSTMFDGNYPPIVAETLSQYTWGWHSETGLHFLRMLAAGVFDKYPRLQLVLGHLGEMLPFMFERIEGIVERAWPFAGVKLKRSFKEVWDNNVWITISGWWYRAPMEVVLKRCKTDRICYSVDYPFGRGEGGPKFLEELAKDGLITSAELESIAYRNAERLLGFEVMS